MRRRRCKAHQRVPVARWPLPDQDDLSTAPEREGIVLPLLDEGVRARVLSWEELQAAIVKMRDHPYGDLPRMYWQ